MELTEIGLLEFACFGDDELGRCFRSELDGEAVMVRRGLFGLGAEQFLLRIDGVLNKQGLLFGIDVVNGVGRGRVQCAAREDDAARGAHDAGHARVGVEVGGDAGAPGRPSN